MTFAANEIVIGSPAGSDVVGCELVVTALEDGAVDVVDEVGVTLALGARDEAPDVDNDKELVSHAATKRIVSKVIHTFFIVFLILLYVIEL
jgi:hypothetical protein